MLSEREPHDPPALLAAPAALAPVGRLATEATVSACTTHRITIPGACFGVVVRVGRIADAAPIGRWMIGKTEKQIRNWVRQKGGTMDELPETPR